MASKQKNYQVVKGSRFSGLSAWVRIAYFPLLLVGSGSLLIWFFIDFNLNQGWLALLGAIIGTMIGWFLQRPLAGIVNIQKGNGGRKLNDTRLLIVAISINLMPLILQSVNEAFGPSDAICNDHEILLKHKRGYKNRGTAVDIEYKGVKTKLDIPWDLYNDVFSGDSLRICIKTGALGFEYPSEIRKAGS